MMHHDPIYGVWELPKLVEELSHTREMSRLRNIVQGVVPNSICPYVTMPSRFHHGLGVVFLAEIVLRNNPALAPKRDLLLAAALLHDAGNPPFSHLGESFLKSLNQKDGETFLEDVLHESELRAALELRGIDTSEVVRLVTGKDAPFSDVLNGSLDIDNLDNIRRHNFFAGIREAEFDPILIASAFRWTGGEWVLLEGCREETKRWQSARAAAYGKVYSHLSVESMVSRAIAIAFERGEIEIDFFHLDDERALRHLKEKCNGETSALIERALRWEQFAEIARITTENPSEKLKHLIEDDWREEYALSNRIADELSVPAGNVSANGYRGVDRRKIKLPFVDEGGAREYDESEEAPIYRLVVHASPELAERKAEVVEILRREFPEEL